MTLQLIDRRYQIYEAHQVCKKQKQSEHHRGLQRHGRERVAFFFPRSGATERRALSRTMLTGNGIFVRSERKRGEGG